MIHINSFVRRQTKVSPYSYWIISDDELIKRIKENFKQAKPGYRDGVILVPVTPEGFYSSTIKLNDGDLLIGEFSKRKDNEEPRKGTYAVRGEKLPVQYVDVVLYSHDVLKENSENESDEEWEIVSINASDVKNTPIPTGALIANHFELSGGTSTNLTDSEFVALLRESVMYWKDKAMLATKEQIERHW